MTAPASSFQRRRLREIIRRIREQVDLTQDQAAKAMEWSTSKIIRIESGQVGISVNDLRGLLALYHITDRDKIDELVQLARTSRMRSWVAPYRDLLNPGFVMYVELEAAASELRNFQGPLLPGLLQTKDYAEACIDESMKATGRTGNVATLVDIRMRRQRELFGRPEPPSVYFVLDEAVLRRAVGGRSVMRAQLEKLLELGKNDNVHITVIPFAHGVHAGVSGSFTVMDFPDADTAPPMLYQEGSFEDRVIRDKPEVVSTYRKTFDHLANGALDEAESTAFIRQVADEMQ